jgi:hypothetical protein
LRGCAWKKSSMRRVALIDEEVDPSCDARTGVDPGHV